MAEDKKLIAFSETGHVFEDDGYGEPKNNEYDEQHWGISCVICGWYECTMCNSNWKNEVCEERANQPTLPGLEFA